MVRGGRSRRWWWWRGKVREALVWWLDFSLLRRNNLFACLSFDRQFFSCFTFIDTEHVSVISSPFSWQNDSITPIPVIWLQYPVHDMDNSVWGRNVRSIQWTNVRFNKPTYLTCLYVFWPIVHDTTKQEEKRLVTQGRVGYTILYNKLTWASIDSDTNLNFLIWQ